MALYDGHVAVLVVVVVYTSSSFVDTSVQRQTWSKFVFLTTDKHDKTAKLNFN